MIHRDIKPENILISHLRTVGGVVDYRSLSVKIVVVFGMLENRSISVQLFSLNPLPASTDQCTKLYAPPEAMNNRYSQVLKISMVDI